LRALQGELAATTPDPAYDVGYSTIHVGTIRGGEAQYRACDLRAGIRDPQSGQRRPAGHRTEIRARAEAIIAPWRQDFPEAALEIEAVNAYPGLDTRHPGALAFARTLSGSNAAPIRSRSGPKADCSRRLWASRPSSADPDRWSKGTSPMSS
jgi:acetylornithine deacetylase